jgi:hypothetical protein
VRRSGVRNSSVRLSYAAATASSLISISSTRSSGSSVMKVSARYSGAVNWAWCASWNSVSCSSVGAGTSVTDSIGTGT